jgi:Domain of unknown function (DUF4411)
LIGEKVKYCLDSNIFIESQKNYYSFEIAPTFWNALVTWGEEQIICSTTAVYEDLIAFSDKLSQWARADGKVLFVDHDPQTYKFYSEIADLVTKNYEPHQAESFLDCSDPWVIAYAKANGLVVVTLEVLRQETVNKTTGKIGMKKIQIPNICKMMGVTYINTFLLLQDLKFSFR